MPVFGSGREQSRYPSSGRAAWFALFLFLALAAGQSCALLPRSPGAEASAGATLTVLRGIVEVFRAGTGNRQAAAVGMLLQSGDQVFTLVAAHALLTFTDGSPVELEPETTMTVKMLAPGRAGSDVTLEQSAGTTWSRVVAQGDASPRFVLETPTASTATRYPV